MKYLSVCSGIEAASCAWEPLGWEPVGFSEIEKFPSAVLAHRFPHVKNYGDMTKFKEWNLGKSIDLLVGGTPCQSFSVAGLRKGLKDPRGNLMLTFGAIANHFKPRFIVWENVPGVLSSNGGRDFGTFLGMLEECGYGFAYRVLDAQFFGVPQRRRRVFVVGCLGDWVTPAKVLFEPESLCGDIETRRKARTGVAALTANGVGTCGADDNQAQSGHLIVMAHGQANAEIRQDSQATTLTCNHEEPILAFQQNQLGEVRTSEIVGTLNTNSNASGRNTPMIYNSTVRREAPILALAGNIIGRKPENGGNGPGYQKDISYTLTKTDQHGVFTGSTVRRLTPLECERLQGFHDNWTNIPGAKDGPRYKAIGNSMAVPVMRWIGERINDNR